MRRIIEIVGRVTLVWAVGSFAIGSFAMGAAPDFNRDIRPLLASSCIACHGHDEETREADLRLDVRESAIAKRDSGPAIVPGDSKNSELYRRIISTDEDEVMPPKDSGHELTKQQITLLKEWIDAGAEYAVHWSFELPVSSALPKIVNNKWPRNDLDFFIGRRLEAAGLQPAEQADRFTLARRLYLDLTGLPPSYEQAKEFAADESPEAYEKLVDQLLESPRFGEHWARMWLDLARYADTKGYEKDQARNIWRYRDWVIDAFNRDLPYDQFTVEQLAGDLLPGATSEQLLATAFHRNTMTNDEGGTDNEEFRTLAVKDRVDTTMQVWMGLTFGCGKCHSHKYDPISQHDYYAMYAFFNQTEDADRGDDAPRVPTPTVEQREYLKLKQTRIEKLKKTLEAHKKETNEAKTITKEISIAEKEIANMKKQIVQTPVMRDLPANRARQTKIHVRGNFLNQGQPVTAAVPESFGKLPDKSTLNRLAMARWLVDSNNPLTARVAVNRFWGRFFGRGIVETEEDFGTQGMLPSHPQLLDWLAVRFQEELGWSMKQLCKEIVMSATYRQSSKVTAAVLQKDPDNRLLSRSPRFRLPAETIRDQALAVAGLLSGKIGGPSVMPHQPPGIWKTTYSKLQWKTSDGEDGYRRGLYTFWRRTSPYPSMLTFDAGSREVCVIRRIRTNTPLQALVILNDPVFFEAAGRLATETLAEKGDDKSHVDSMFRRVLVRDPTSDEAERLVQFMAKVSSDFQDSPAAKEVVESARLQLPADANIAEFATWTMVANVLLNLDELLMRN